MHGLWGNAIQRGPGHVSLPEAVFSGNLQFSNGNNCFLWPCGLDSAVTFCKSEWPVGNSSKSVVWRDHIFFFFWWERVLIATLLHRSFLSILLIHFSMFHWPPVSPRTWHLREHSQTLVTLSCPSSMPLLRYLSKACFSRSYGCWDVLTITLLAFNWYMLHPPNSLSYASLFNVIFSVCFLRSITSYFNTLSKF